jgi:hypothetical protein
MTKYIKLKEVLSLTNLYNEYIHEFTTRKDENTTIEFKFDFEGLSVVEEIGYSCYLNKMEHRLFNDWQGITKYLKRISQIIDKVTVYKYEFYTEKEYKWNKFKRRLLFGLEMIGLIGVAVTWGQLFLNN